MQRPTGRCSKNRSNRLSRTLKKAPNFVLGSSQSSTYPSREKSCSDSSGLGGWKSGLFEHPGRGEK